VVKLRPSDYQGVFTDGRDFFTPNLVAGTQVYGEKLLVSEGREFRRWDPYRSKLAALMQKGCPVWPFKSDSEILYLGAASGTTVSHLSDVCMKGKLCCVEISPREFRKLLDVASRRPNMIPFLGDASRPDTYKNLLDSVDVVYQDIAQRDQVQIFLRNLELLKPGGHGFLMVKARSIDVAERPESIYERVSGKISSRHLEVLKLVKLGPFEKDHAAVVIRRPSGQA